MKQMGQDMLILRFVSACIKKKKSLATVLHQLKSGETAASVSTHLNDTGMEGRVQIMSLCFL